MKNKFWKIIIAVGLSMNGIVAYADASGEFSRRLNNLGTFQAQFTQRVTNPNGKVVQESRGSMAIQRPGKFRWESLTPMHQLIIADGENIWIYDVDLKQVTVKRLRNANGDNPALFLSGFSRKVSGYFTVEQNGNEFKLTPKRKGTDFQEILFVFRGEVMQRMRLTDNLGQSSDLQFQGMKMNQSIKPATFVMVVPNGVDEIRPKN